MVRVLVQEHAASWCGWDWRRSSSFCDFSFRLQTNANDHHTNEKCWFSSSSVPLPINSSCISFERNCETHMNLVVTPVSVSKDMRLFLLPTLRAARQSTHDREKQFSLVPVSCSAVVGIHAVITSLLPPSAAVRVTHSLSSIDQWRPFVTGADAAKKVRKDKDLMHAHRHNELTFSLTHLLLLLSRLSPSHQRTERARWES